MKITKKIGWQKYESALEDQLAEEREKRVKLEKELAEFHKNQDEVDTEE